MVKLQVVQGFYRKEVILMFSQIRVSKIVLLFAIILTIGVLLSNILDLRAASTCMTCHPTQGCLTTTYGFNNCTSSWSNGQMISCTLSGGECGGTVVIEYPGLLGSYK